MRPTLAEVKNFFSTYYAPNNAALAVVGDFEPAEAKKYDREVFWRHSHQSASRQAARHHRAQPGEGAKRAPRWILWPSGRRWRFRYHMPERNTPEYYAMGLIDQMLAARRRQPAA